MYRIVIDTDVLIDGVQDQESNNYKIIETCIANKIEATNSPEIEKDFEEKAEKIKNKNESFDILDEFYKSCDEVEPSQKLNVVSDKNANKFIEAASEGDVDFIVTENSDLLDMDEYEGIRMITPQQMWDMYSDEASENNSWDNWDE